MNRKLKPAALTLCLAMSSSSAFAVDYYLAAKAYTKTLPDGSTVPMWGYVEDSGGSCFNAASDAARLTCIGGLPDPVAQGPRLTVPSTQTALRVYLSNGLPEPTSIVISGQEMPIGNYPGISPVSGPTWNDGSTGNRTDASQRVRSFVPEAPANGGKMGYIWNNNQNTPIANPGSFIYHSGTWPQKQVYMGLAGLVTKDNAANQAYPGVSYDNEVVLFYSDIDPDFNAAVDAGSLTTSINRHPRWFLVNGEPYHNGLGDIVSGFAGPLAASTNTLLRFASTATDTHVAVLQGMDMTIYAEDGLPYTWQEQGLGGATHPAPRKQYSAKLPPAKTKDAIIFAPELGRFAVYDGNGYMTNPSDPNNEAVGDTVGGMLRFLSFGSGTNQAPTAVADAATVIEGQSVVIAVLGNDTDPENDLLSIETGSVTTPTAGGSVTCTEGTPGGTCNFDATGLTAGTVSAFNYNAIDQTGSNTGSTATVTVTVQAAPANIPPVANDDSTTAVAGGAPFNIDVLANDTDTDGPNALTVASIDTTGTAGSVDCSTVNTICSYTPPAAGFTGNDTFTYIATDGADPSNSATVTVTVSAPNLAPTANDDPGNTTPINTQLVIDVLTNDTDPESDPLSIASFDTTGTTGSVVCVTGVVGGTCTYTPPTGQTYTGDTFTYTATDGVNTSNTATVTVDVTGAGAPVLYFSTLGAGSVPGTAGPYDDGDVYTADAGNTFSRLYDAVSDLGLPNNADIDGISVDGTTVYLSFAAATTNVPGLGNVPDEDVLAYDTVGGTFSLFFDGSYCGLDASNGQDIDALSVVGTTLYFSTAGGGAANSVGGVTGPSGDDADIYTWTGGTTGTANCSRVVDATADWGLPRRADINGLTIDGGNYYVTFLTATTIGGSTFQDTDIALYDGTSWTRHFNGAPLGLAPDGIQDLDAIHIVPAP